MALIEHCWPDQDMVERMWAGYCPVKGCLHYLLPAYLTGCSAAAGNCPRHGAFSLQSVRNKPGTYALVRYNQYEVRRDPT